MNVCGLRVRDDSKTPHFTTSLQHLCTVLIAVGYRNTCQGFIQNLGHGGEAKPGGGGGGVGWLVGWLGELPLSLL